MASRIQESPSLPRPVRFAAAGRFVLGWCQDGLDSAVGRTTPITRKSAAIVDRLTFNGAIIQTGTESYRLAHTKAQAERAQVS